MKKITTIFERDWEGSRGVVDSPLFGPADFEGAVATEKLDGMNVRVTVRSGKGVRPKAVRLEKRRNPSKLEKKQGIEEPWYVDADPYSPEDKWIYDALANTDLDVPDGEWSGEAVGTNIQGNPLNLDKNTIVFFTLGRAPVFENVPTTFAELKEWLPRQRSKYGNNCGIEGIVWHKDGQPFGKIKIKDFKS